MLASICLIAFFNFIKVDYTEVKKLSYSFSKDSIPSHFSKQLFDESSSTIDIVPLQDYSLREIYYDDILDLNTITEENLRKLNILSDVQIRNFINYRKKFKKIISKHELWAIEGWNQDVIKQILPYVEVGEVGLMYNSATKKNKTVLIQTIRYPIETAEGFFRDQDSVSAFLGTKEAVQFRYRGEYNSWKTFVQASKSSGERSIFTHGFDFIGLSVIKSFHSKSFIQKLILGDYTVQFGQGLMEWQRFAFYKNIPTTDIYIVEEPFRAFTSIANYRKRRGIALMFKKRSIDFGLFGSLNKANSRTDTNYNNSGLAVNHHNYNYYLHRTQTEIARKYNTNIISYGGYLKLHFNNSHVGFNYSSVHFNKPTALPHLRNAPRQVITNNYISTSTDWKLSLNNVLLFGEIAASQNRAFAGLMGMQIAANRLLSFSILYRAYSPNYVSLYSNSFRNFSYVNNENGFYIGMKYSLRKKLHAQAYIDIYTRPQLFAQNRIFDYGVDGLISTEYWIDKFYRLLSIFRFENNLYNIKSTTNNNPYRDSFFTFFSLRNDFEIKVNEVVKVVLRNDFKFNSQLFRIGSFSQFYSVRVFYKDIFKKFNVTSGLYFFDVEPNVTNFFIYENDLLYNFRILNLSNSGIRYFSVISKSIKRYLKINFKWSQTIFDFNTPTSSSVSSINSRFRSELATQIILKF